MSFIKTLAFFLLLGFSNQIIGQQQYISIVQNHLDQKRDHFLLEKGDYESLWLSSYVQDKDLTYVYINQAYKNIPIANTMITAIIRDGKVVSDFNNFIPQISKKINSTKPNIDAERAIKDAAKHFEVNLTQVTKNQNRTDGTRQFYRAPEFTKTDISAELTYVHVGNELRLAWNLQLDMKASSDYWDMYVDAQNGKAIHKHNYTLYCQHEKGTYINHDNCAVDNVRKLGDLRSKLNHNLQEISSNKATYNVFPFPVESPIHGERALVFDDAFPEASPYGWHDVNGVTGAEFTITRGNNVHAYEDKDDNSFSDGDEPNGGSGLIFDFPLDMNQDPRISNYASVTNLFYAVNMMHDLSFLIGFTEEFGNFQAKNYTFNDANAQNDEVEAEAFDGISLHEAGQTETPKINNANFSTPRDGFNGRMQMFFWNNPGNGAINFSQPEEIKGGLQDYGVGDFGASIPTKSETPIIGKVVIARGGTGANTNFMCGSANNPDDIKGNIALIDRGICQFGTKTLNAQRAGAIAVIICNVAGVNGGTGEEIINMAGGNDGTNVNIPSIFMKKSDCDKIRLLISEGKEVIMIWQEQGDKVRYLDGSLDNGIIAHEFGHGISNRLTAGRNNTGCLGNDEQMGEGWSDYFSLVFFHKPGDKGEDPKGIGNFASGRRPTGVGIRRFPYSTDMKVNGQTFDDIKGTNGPHALGEVWVTMLWDMYWAFIDKYGYDPNLRNKESGNFKAMNLVMQGMKMQTCNPGFIQGRDAIMKADELIYNGENVCLLWDVFARRGLGYFAVGGSTSDRSDGKENFDAFPLCIKELKITKEISSSVSPGEEINVTLKAINHIADISSDVVITDQLEDGMVYVDGSSTLAPKIDGNTLVFEIGDLVYDKEIIITYKVRVDKDKKSILLYQENFDGDFDWDVEIASGSDSWYTSYDIFKSPEVSFGVGNAATETDASLLSIPYRISGRSPAMKFSHRYNTEPGSDGGFVEISVDGGDYTPIPSTKFLRNSYTNNLPWTTLPIPGIRAFTGVTPGDWNNTFQGTWIDSYIDLTEYVGKEVQFKFRFATDDNTAPETALNGWFIDDFQIIDILKYRTEACIGADGGSSSKACTKVFETFIEGDLGSSIRDVESIYDVVVSPNPTKDFIHVNASSKVAHDAQISLVAIDGTILINDNMYVQERQSTKTIWVGNLPAGVYFLKLKNNKEQLVKKIIIH